MMTREEILSIEDYCAEHKISHKKRLEELEIPPNLQYRNGHYGNSRYDKCIDLRVKTLRYHISWAVNGGYVKSP